MEAHVRVKPQLHLSRPQKPVPQTQTPPPKTERRQRQHEPVVAKPREDPALSTALWGVDLVEQVANNTAIQRHRWTELYRRLWERKAKVDIVDTVLMANGSVCAWYFTSAATGELKRKSEDKLNASSIRRQCLKSTVRSTTSAREGSGQRPLARLIYEEEGDLACSLLTSDDLSFVVNHPPSALSMVSVLLQPLLPLSCQPPQARGTFVAKYNALATSSCVRVLHLERGGLYGLPASHIDATTCGGDSKLQLVRTTGARSVRRPNSAPAYPQTHKIEDIVKSELRKLVHEVELGFRDRIRLLTAEFQISDTHRLMLVRVSSIVFFSDLDQSKKPVKKYAREVTRVASGSEARRSSLLRPKFGGVIDLRSKCAGRVFCHCQALVSAGGSRKVGLPRGREELQQITRKSLLLSENESVFLTHFGAEAEATLLPAQAPIITGSAAWDRQGKRGDSQDLPVAKLLQRRIFMLQNTLWNPKSDAFDPNALGFDDTQRLPQQYEMVVVCPACYLIYQAIDSERFQRCRSTARAASRKTTALHRSRFLASEQVALSHLNANRHNGHDHAPVRAAWADDETSTAGSSES